MTSIFLFLLGIAVGSFLNVAVDRPQKRRSVLSGRSKCDFCKKVLAWYDLFPIVSFVTLRARCRYCKHTLSWQYPVVEAATGFAFLFVYFMVISGPHDANIIHLTHVIIVTSCLIGIFVADVKYRIIPDGFLAVAFVSTIVNLTLVSPGSFVVHALSAFILCAFFYSLVVFTQGRGMGLGDVKYSAFMGLFLGFPASLVAFYLAFLTGALFSLILIVCRKKRMGDAIAFGPFLVVATFISFFYSDAIWEFFIKAIGIS